LEFLQILLDLNFGGCQTLLQLNIVSVGNVQKLHATSTKSLNSFDDVIGPAKRKHRTIFNSYKNIEGMLSGIFG